jgi:hypothetical protein
VIIVNHNVFVLFDCLTTAISSKVRYRTGTVPGIANQKKAISIKNTGFALFENRPQSAVTQYRVEYYYTVSRIKWAAHFRARNIVIEACFHYKQIEAVLH